MRVLRPMRCHAEEMMSSYSMANRAPWRPLVLGLTLSVGLGCGGDGPINPDKGDDAG